jgi:hypothetical protein
MLRRPLAILTHRGWLALGARTGVDRAKSGSSGKGLAGTGSTKWRAAIEQRARIARTDARSRLLCLGTDDGQLEIWDLRKDQRLFLGQVPNIDQLLALSDACVVRSRRAVRWYNRAGAYRELHAEATAVVLNDQRLYVTGARKITEFDARGTKVIDRPGGDGATALLRLPTRFVVGHRDGNLELLPLSRGTRQPAFTFENVPSSPVLRLVPGPTGTVIAGYANGLVGLWNLANGTQLYRTQLHGPVIHLRREAGRLYAATELGDYRVLDLRVFHLDYCQLLRQVWRKVRVVWEKGLPVRRGVPNDHRCAKK